MKDIFGLSWQIAPSILPEMLADSDTKKVQSVTRAYLQMKKFDLATMMEAYDHA